MKGLWVICFQKFPDKIKDPTPFFGQIVKETSTHWILKHGKHEVRANKGACSTVPFEYNPRTGETKRPKAAVESPEKDGRTGSKAGTRVRRQRSGDGKDTGASSRVRSAPKEGRKVPAGTGAKKSLAERLGKRPG